MKKTSREWRRSESPTAVATGLLLELVPQYLQDEKTPASFRDLVAQMVDIIARQEEMIAELQGHLVTHQRNLEQHLKLRAVLGLQEGFDHFANDTMEEFIHFLLSWFCGELLNSGINRVLYLRLEKDPNAPPKEHRNRAIVVAGVGPHIPLAGTAIDFPEEEFRNLEDCVTVHTPTNAFGIDYWIGLTSMNVAHHLEDLDIELNMQPERGIIALDDTSSALQLKSNDSLQLLIMEMAETFTRGLSDKRRAWATLQRAQLDRMRAETDPLTEIKNQRGILPILHAKVECALAGREDITIGLIDCNKFKSINDNNDHATGDIVIKALAKHLSQPGMHVARMGGDEFMVIIEGNHAHAAEVIADLQVSWSNIRFNGTQGKRFRTTFSAGLCEVTLNDVRQSCEDWASGKYVAVRTEDMVVLDLALKECSPLTPDNIRTIATILKIKADQRMYEAKEARSLIMLAPEREQPKT